MQRVGARKSRYFLQKNSENLLHDYQVPAVPKKWKLCHEIYMAPYSLDQTVIFQGKQYKKSK